MHKSRLSTFVIDCETPDIEAAGRFWSAALGRTASRTESDDLEAEVRRLEALGAKRIGFVKRWWVMEAPTGQRFCVVNPQRGPLGDDANQWP